MPNQSPIEIAAELLNTQAARSVWATAYGSIRGCTTASLEAFNKVIEFRNQERPEYQNEEIAQAMVELMNKPTESDARAHALETQLIQTQQHVSDQAEYIEELKLALGLIRERICRSGHNVEGLFHNRHGRNVCKRCGLQIDHENNVVGDYYITKKEPQALHG